MAAAAVADAGNQDSIALDAAVCLSPTKKQVIWSWTTQFDEVHQTMQATRSVRLRCPHCQETFHELTSVSTTAMERARKEAKKHFDSCMTTEIARDLKPDMLISPKHRSRADKKRHDAIQVAAAAAAAAAVEVNHPAVLDIALPTPAPGDAHPLPEVLQLEEQFNAVAPPRRVRIYKPSAACGPLFQCARGGHCWHRATGSHHMMCTVADCAKCWWSQTPDLSPDLMVEIGLHHRLAHRAAAPQPVRCSSWTQAAPLDHEHMWTTRQVRCGTILNDGTECCNPIHRQCETCGQLSQLLVDEIQMCPYCGRDDDTYLNDASAAGSRSLRSSFNGLSLSGENAQRESTAHGSSAEQHDQRESTAHGSSGEQHDQRESGPPSVQEGEAGQEEEKQSQSVQKGALPSLP